MKIITALIFSILLSISIQARAQSLGKDIQIAPINANNLCQEEYNALDKTLTNILEKEGDFRQTYQLLTLKISALTTKSRIYGYNTTQLEENNETLQTQIAQFNTYLDELIQNLNLAKTNACKENNYKEQARVSLANVTQKTSEIASFYNNTIVQTILNLEK